MIESDSAPSISYTPSLLMRQLTKQSLGPEQAMSVRDFKQNKATGRNQAVNTNLRPDLWKVVYDSVKTLSKVKSRWGYGVPKTRCESKVVTQVKFG